MALTVEDWVNHQGDLCEGDPGYAANLGGSAEVQANSHTPEKAFGRIMAKCKPRLGAITHCHFNQDTLVTAMRKVSEYYTGPLAWAIDAWSSTCGRARTSSSAWRSSPTSDGT
jgi:hypothetical protein